MVDKFYLPLRLDLEKFVLLQFQLETTVGDLLKTCFGPNTTKRLFQIKFDVAFRAVESLLLSNDTMVCQLKDVNWQATRAQECNAWIVEDDCPIHVFFNDYFRMRIGYPARHLRLFPFSNDMVAGDLEILLRQLTKQKENAGLYGDFHEGVQSIEPTALLADLIKCQDANNPGFFQFQLHLELQDQYFMGITARSRLIVKLPGIRSATRKLCYLKGTSLFLEDQKAPGNSCVYEIQHIDEYDIDIRSDFDFILRPPTDGRRLPALRLSGTNKKTIAKWIASLRAAHPAYQAMDPVDLAKVSKLPRPLYNPFRSRLFDGAPDDLVETKKAISRNSSRADLRDIERLENRFKSLSVGEDPAPSLMRPSSPIAVDGVEDEVAFVDWLLKNPDFVRMMRDFKQQC